MSVSESLLEVVLRPFSQRMSNIGTKTWCPLEAIFKYRYEIGVT
jgi:hypothetical protein